MCCALRVLSACACMCVACAIGVRMHALACVRVLFCLRMAGCACAVRRAAKQPVCLHPGGEAATGRKGTCACASRAVGVLMRVDFMNQASESSPGYRGQSVRRPRPGQVDGVWQPCTLQNLGFLRFAAARGVIIRAGTIPGTGGAIAGIDGIMAVTTAPVEAAGAARWLIRVTTFARTAALSSTRRTRVTSATIGAGAADEPAAPSSSSLKTS